MNLRAKSQKGFTIVELLIVIVVIAILAAISIVAYTGVQENARNTQRAANAKAVIDAANAYNAENGSFPTVAQLQGYSTVRIPSDLTISATNPTTTTKEAIGYVTTATSATVTYWDGKPATTSPVKAANLSTYKSGS